LPVKHHGHDDERDFQQKESTKEASSR